MKITIILLLVASCITLGFALHCYDCDTKTDANCANDGYNKKTMKCPEPNSMDKFSAATAVCLKDVTTENGVMGTVRSCTFESRQLVACSLVPNKGDYCSTCEKDLCNSAEHRIINLMMSIVPIAAILSFKLL